MAVDFRPKAEFTLFLITKKIAELLEKYRVAHETKPLSRIIIKSYLTPILRLDFSTISTTKKE